MKRILPVKKRAALLLAEYPGSRISKVLCTQVLDSHQSDGGTRPMGTETSNLAMAVPLKDGRYDLDHSYNPSLRRIRNAAVPLHARAVAFMLVDEWGNAIADAEIFAFVNLETGEGAHGKTCPDGVAILNLSAKATSIQQLYLYKPHETWPMVRRNIFLKGDSIKIRCK
jgi:hypothetical protein